MRSQPLVMTWRSFKNSSYTKWYNTGGGVLLVVISSAHTLCVTIKCVRHRHRHRNTFSPPDIAASRTNIKVWQIRLGWEADLTREPRQADDAPRSTRWEEAGRDGSWPPRLPRPPAATWSPTFFSFPLLDFNVVTREILKNTGTENDPTEIRLLLQNEILANCNEGSSIVQQILVMRGEGTNLFSKNTT